MYMLDERAVMDYMDTRGGYDSYTGAGVPNLQDISDLEITALGIPIIELLRQTNVGDEITLLLSRADSC